ncbi:nitrogen fixation protein FixH [Evansella vedderi]|uniref:Nitrogen fixation protein FixH n=1 Tax=Evansella vedderi TaxID=38282 RepID=A0ABT9ZPX6_9BACI|nr:FixH family protein [Evansella vedderi]MDQ0253292.1 nitrogen fixation protein FixH [Evansella vedderi]
MPKIKKQYKLVILSILFLAFLVGCGGGGNWVVQLENEPVYERGEKTKIVFTVVDGEAPVNDLQISALLEMSRMDHGHIEVDFINVDNGVYLGEVELAMPGEWIASLTIVSGTDEYEKMMEFEVGDGHD